MHHMKDCGRLVVLIRLPIGGALGANAPVIVIHKAAAIGGNLQRRTSVAALFCIAQPSSDQASEASSAKLGIYIISRVMARVMIR